MAIAKNNIILSLHMFAKILIFPSGTQGIITHSYFRHVLQMKLCPKSNQTYIYIKVTRYICDVTYVSVEICV